MLPASLVPPRKRRGAGAPDGPDASASPLLQLLSGPGGVGGDRVTRPVAPFPAVSAMPGSREQGGMASVGLLAQAAAGGGRRKAKRGLPVSTY